MVWTSALSKLRLKVERGRYSLYVALFVASVISPLAIPAVTASASETFTAHAISSSYTSLTQ